MAYPLHINTLDGTSRLVVGKVEGIKVSDETLKNTLHKKFFLETGVLPPVVRWMSASRKYILLERPPMLQTISFHAAKRNDIPDGNAREHAFTIPIPWTLYAIELGEDCYPINISVYAMKHMLTSLDDQLGVLPLPNYYNTGSICMPNRDYNDVTTTIAQGVNAAYRIAWHSGFNLDINYTIRSAVQTAKPAGLFREAYGKTTPLKLYRTWQKLSIEEIASWKDWLIPRGYGAGVNVLAEHHYTVAHLIQRFNTFDAEKGMNDPINNLVIATKEAFAASMLN